MTRHDRAHFPALLLSRLAGKGRRRRWSVGRSVQGLIHSRLAQPTSSLAVAELEAGPVLPSRPMAGQLSSPHNARPHCEAARPRRASMTSGLLRDADSGRVES